MLLGIAPLRISFGGGGTDLEEYHNIHEGFTISATISKFTYVFVRVRNDNKIQSFSPDFASHLPPKVIDKIRSTQGHEIVLNNESYFDTLSIKLNNLDEKDLEHRALDKLFNFKSC